MGGAPIVAGHPSSQAVNVNHGLETSRLATLKKILGVFFFKFNERIVIFNTYQYKVRNIFHLSLVYLTVTTFKHLFLLINGHFTASNRVLARNEIRFYYT